VIAPRYREDICLDAAAALEDRVGILTPMDPRSALIRMNLGNFQSRLRANRQRLTPSRRHG
jgi:hypothetical protein